MTGRLGIRGRLVAAMVGIAALVTVGLLTASTSRLDEVTERSYEAGQEALAALLADTLVPAMEFEDEAEAGRVLESALRNPNIQSAAVLKLNGEPLVRRHRGSVEGNVRIYDHPLMSRLGEPLGSVRLGVSLAGRDGVLRESWRQALDIGIVALLLTLIAAWTLGHYLTQPVLELTEGTQQVQRSGHLRQFVEVRSHDEVGALAVAFNEMLAALDDATVSKDFMLTITDAMTDVLLVVNPDGTVRSINEAGAALVGAPADELVGRPVDGFSDVSDAFDEVRAVGRVVDRDATLSGPEGEVAVSFSAARLGSPGATQGYVVNAHDMRATNRLIQRLEAAWHRAEAASEAKREFLAKVSHELRTPLNGIIGMGDILERTALTPEQRDLQRTVRTSADTLLTLVNEILDISKAGSGQLTLDPAPMELRPVVELALEGLAHGAHAAGLELVADLDLEGLPSVVGDAQRIRQILLNVVGNAIKFTPQGEVVCRASWAREGDEIRVSFSVEDTGEGIPTDHQDAVFEPFVQVDESLSRGHGGTGLGLAICANLVGLMGGQMRLESEVGRGSTFAFDLHLTADDSAPTEVDIEAKVEAPLPHRLLLVEGNAAAREALAAQLVRWGARVCAVATAAEAMAAEGPFDVALVAGSLPEGGPATLTAALREATPGLRAVRLCRIGAAEAEPDASTALLHKPVTRAALARALEAQPAQRTAPTPPPVASQSLDVLLAEDNPVNQRVATLMLKRAGHSVVVAANGADALNRFDEQHFDLVLMDLQMPVMDGLEAIRRIRQRETRTGGHVPIIALTAHAVDGYQERSVASGADGFQSKPLTAKALDAAISAVMPAAPAATPQPLRPSGTS